MPRIQKISDYSDSKRPISFDRTETWEKELARSFKTPQELLYFLGLQPNNSPYPLELHPKFPFLITQEFARKIIPGNWYDPLLLQILPQKEEGKSLETFELDPVGDVQAIKAKGILQKYQGRALLLPTPACAIHCRYCFRQNLALNSYSGKSALTPEIKIHLKNNSEIEEIIFSGGDPMLLPNLHWAQHLQDLAEFPHISRIRIHTRFPVILGTRFNENFWQTLQKYQKRFTWIWVTHSNHPNELGPESQEVFSQILKFSPHLLNQSVLLRKINDSVEILKEHSLKLLGMGVKPYYIHQLDKVKGTQHFEVPISEGLKIMQDLQAVLPGYALPRYVQEIAGEPSKTSLF